MNTLEFGQYTRKVARYSSETNQLKLFIKRKASTNKREVYMLDASAVQYLIKVWRDFPFHEVIDETSFLHYSLRALRRLRTGIRILGPDKLPTYSLQVITGDPWNPWDCQHVYAENPVFLYQEWNNFCSWISTLFIPKNEERFSHLTFAQVSWEEFVSNRIG